VHTNLLFINNSSPPHFFLVLKFWHRKTALDLAEHVTFEDVLIGNNQVN